MEILAAERIGHSSRKSTARALDRPRSVLRSADTATPRLFDLGQLTRSANQADGSGLGYLFATSGIEARLRYKQRATGAAGVVALKILCVAVGTLDEF